jgi:hypothetical protein
MGCLKNTEKDLFGVGRQEIRKSIGVLSLPVWGRMGMIGKQTLP